MKPCKHCNTRTPGMVPCNTENLVIAGPTEKLKSGKRGQARSRDMVMSHRVTSWIPCPKCGGTRNKNKQQTVAA